jgi:hypothetical protein
VRPGEPGVDADEVDGQRGQHVLQVGLGQTSIAGLMEVAEPGGLGEQALDAAAQAIALAPVVGGLLGPDPLLGLLLAAGKITCRALSWERVQRARSGQGRQSGCRKVARMTGRPSRLRAGWQFG